MEFIQLFYEWQAYQGRRLQWTVRFLTITVLTSAVLIAWGLFVNMSIGLIITGVLLTFGGMVLFGILRHLVLLVLGRVTGELQPRVKQAIDAYLKLISIVVLAEAIGLNYLGLVFLFGTPDKVVFGVIALAVLIILLGGGIKGERFIPTVTGLAWVEFALATAYLLAPEELKALFGGLRNLPFVGNLGLLVIGYLVVTKVSKSRAGQITAHVVDVHVEGHTSQLSTGHGTGNNGGHGKTTGALKIISALLAVVFAGFTGVAIFSPKTLSPESRATAIAKTGEIARDIKTGAEERIKIITGEPADSLYRHFKKISKTTGTIEETIDLDATAKVVVYRKTMANFGEFVPTRHEVYEGSKVTYVSGDSDSLYVAKVIMTDSKPVIFKGKQIGKGNAFVIKGNPGLLYLQGAGTVKIRIE